ncbi:MAG: IRE (iron responsive element), partial [Planctomycetota bacterium]
MVVLLVPLYFLGNPSVRNPDGSVKVEGGTLAQIRTQYNLGQGDLGEIDPASESMRLATLGLRGVAATILWQKAEYYKKEMYWDRLAATLNQIAVLQPHFIKVWEFQSHNLSYNVSAEFDDYRHRYDWVKKGIDYLIKGMKYNKHRTELPYELGWFFGNKMGVADERIQFRELYRNDKDFHAQVLAKTGVDLTQQEGLGPDRKPDNWLSGRLWYEYAYDMVARGARPARSTLMFYRMGPQWLMKYSEAIQGDGYLGEPARYAWRTAGREWKKFGERPILTTFGDMIYLTEIDVANEEYRQAKLEFAKFCGETYEQMLAERKAQLTPEELTAYSKDYLDRTFDEALLAEDAAAKLELDPTEVARRLPSEKQVEGLRMAKELKAKRDKIQHIEIYRNQINYAYWEQRCIAEQEDAALAARTNMYEADQLLEKGELDAALEKYELAWQNWNELFNKHPGMMIDDAADAVLESIERYRRLLDQPE